MFCFKPSSMYTAECKDTGANTGSMVDISEENTGSMVDISGDHGNSKCDFSSITVDSSTSYTLDDLIQTNKEGIWKFEFDMSTVRGISLTKSGMAFDNFECVKEFCTSKTNVEVGNWSVTVEMEKDTG